MVVYFNSNSQFYFEPHTVDFNLLHRRFVAVSFVYSTTDVMKASSGGDDYVVTAAGGGGGDGVIFVPDGLCRDDDLSLLRAVAFKLATSLLFVVDVGSSS